MDQVHETQDTTAEPNEPLFAFQAIHNDIVQRVSKLMDREDLTDREDLFDFPRRMNRGNLTDFPGRMDPSFRSLLTGLRIIGFQQVWNYLAFQALAENKRSST